MGADAIGGTGGINFLDTNTDTGKKRTGLTADTETFLKLLVAQMQYQDPLEPQTDSDFVAQLAQLTSLEQMQSMNQSLTASQAMGLVGKLIYAEVLNSETGITDAYTGIVDSVVMQKGVTYVVTGETAIPVDKVLMVTDIEETAPAPETPADPAEETPETAGA